MTIIFTFFFFVVCLFPRFYQAEISSFPLTGELVKHHLIPWAVNEGGVQVAMSAL